MNANEFPQLDVQIYACPSDATAGTQMRLGTVSIEAICVQTEKVGLLPKTLEEFGTELSRQPRCFFELDGSFVWTGDHEGLRWQMDGMIYDRADRIQRVELTGTCPEHIWHFLLGGLGYPQQPLIAYLKHQQCYVAAEQLDLLWN